MPKSHIINTFRSNDPKNIFHKIHNKHRVIADGSELARISKLVGHFDYKVFFVFDCKETGNFMRIFASKSDIEDVYTEDAPFQIHELESVYMRKTRVEKWTELLRIEAQKALSSSIFDGNFYEVGYLPHNKLPEPLFYVEQVNYYTIPRDIVKPLIITGKKEGLIFSLNKPVSSRKGLVSINSLRRIVETI